MAETRFYLSSKVRLYPNQTQEELFRKTIGCCRFIYNCYLAFRLKDYERYKKYLTSGKDPKNFKWKKPPTEVELKREFGWLKEPDATALQSSHRDLEAAFTNYHKSGFGRPKFHKKGYKENFRCYMTLDIDDNKIRIGKNGWVRFRGTVLHGTIKNITVSLDAGKWYASLLFEVPPEVYYRPKKFEAEECGIDLGVSKPFTISSNLTERHEGLNTKRNLERAEQRRKKYQRRMARKIKGSNNRKKAQLKVQRAYQYERNIRRNFQERASYYLASTFKFIVFEDLKIHSMTARGKGKNGLNREMLRLGLSGLVQRTITKATRFGSSVVFVDPRYTSQTCSYCGSIDKQSRKSQSRFCCTSCGFTLNADKNAARNILARGLLH